LFLTGVRALTERAKDVPITLWLILLGKLLYLT